MRSFSKLLAGIWLCALTSVPVASVQTGVEAAPAPDPVSLSLQDLDGRARSIEDYEGQIVVLNFWATWCLPCVEEMPLLVKVQASHGARDVQVVCVSTDDPERREQVRRFVHEHNLNFPVWVDGTIEDMRRFGLGTALPATAILDRDGQIAMKILGPIERGELEERVEWLLGDRAGPGPEPVVNHFGPEIDSPGDRQDADGHEHGDEHEEDHRHGTVGIEGASLVPS